MVFEGILLLISRFFTPTVNGAHGWIVMGPISIQPAEYLKVIIVWFLASNFALKQEEIARYDYQTLTRRTWWPKSWSDLYDWRVGALVLVGLVAIQPDLGNAVIIVLTGVHVFSASGIGYRWYAALLGTIFFDFNNNIRFY